MSKETEPYTLVLKEFLDRSDSSVVCNLYIRKHDLEKGSEFPIVIFGFDRRVKLRTWSFSSLMLHFLTPSFTSLGIMCTGRK